MYGPSIQASLRVLRAFLSGALARNAARFLVLLIVVSLASSAQEVLTNDAVVKMVKSGLPESVVLEMIRTRPAKYSVTSDSLRQLKDQGVTEKELLAIIAKSSGSAPESAGAGEPPAVRQNANVPAPGGHLGIWEVRETKDALTGDVNINTSLLAKNDGGGRVDVSARCSIEDSLSSMAKIFPGMKQVAGQQLFEFRFQYRSPQAGKGLRVETTQLSPATVRETLGGYEVNQPVNLSYVVARLKLDDNVISNRMFAGKDSASLDFVNVKMGEQMAQMVNGGKNDRLSKDPVAAAFLNLPYMAMSGIDPSLPLNDLLKARSLIVDLPLSDGTSALMNLHIEDPNFKKYEDRCVAAFKAATPPAAPTGPVVRPSPLQSLTDRQFNGTADGFVAAFPGYLGRAATAMGIDAKTFSGESAFIVNAVKTCSQITPQMFATVSGPGRGRPDLGALGEQFRVCNGRNIPVSERVRHANRLAERVIDVDFLDSFDGGDTGRKFAVVVSFNSMKADSFRNYAFENYGIVAATIYGSAAAVKQPLASSALQNTNRKFEGSVEEFARIFPGMLEKAAAALSLDPKGYEQETAFIIAAAGTCSQITPEMAQSTAIRFPNGRFGPPDIRKLGDRYKVCAPAPVHSVSDEVKKTYNKETERALMMWLSDRGGQWGSGKGLLLQVYFSPLKSEGNPYEKRFDTLGVVDASIH